ncbi:2,4-dienoyl-CoA reductase [Sphingomonas jatrophae]|uniref:2,4-dienoyl-CoA reductase n=2 Tax=Sphingomonas jatrophae TaxID=1166337 RepID=A0A1I6M017_9SPHN|nr:FAD-dependent oxidoreductase [Sphingomonas jatrophae]SFS09013.1 2,4-dienoyl-CoA reductase [Sphingomonas jatrophae]
MPAFRHLLSPGRINGMTLRNRIFFTPMGSNLAEEGGFSGEKLKDYYEERARGGAALITMGSVSIGYPEGASNWRQEAISDDRYIPGIRAIADAVHAHGAKLAVQLHHAGLLAMHDMLEGRPLACPSPPQASKDSGDFVDVMLEEEQARFFEPYATMGEVKYDALSAQQIERIVQMFADAADRAKRAGVDAVEVHAGHGYIFSSFLSPAYNRRTDEYGGSVENRARFLLDTIKAIRAAVGPNYPVWMRFDSQEFLMDNGITVEDAKAVALLAERAGLDAIHVSAHGDGNRGATYSTGHATDIRNGFVANAAAIKAAISIPVICPGRIEPEDADRFIAEGKLDFVTMGRKLLADPHLPNKLAAGTPDKVRPCIYCYTCISNIFNSKHVICAVNPLTGYERERAQYPAERRKTIVVVGGGPGGLESARLLANKGHKVILCEASSRLGGTAQFASVAYEPNQRIVDWLKNEVARADIDVRLNARVTPELIASLKPDQVIVATGAKRTMPAIPGGNRDFVFSGDDMRNLVLGQNLESLRGKTSGITRTAMKMGAITGATGKLEVLRRASKVWMPIGKRVVIIGGELVGLELAEFLAARDRTVTVLEEGTRVGKGLQLVRRFRVIDECRHLGVAMLTQVSDVRIGDHLVTYTNEDQQQRTIAADTVIVAKGATGDLSLAEAIERLGYPVATVGDCTGVGYIEGAMRDAALAVQTI